MNERLLMLHAGVVYRENENPGNWRTGRKIVNAGVRKM